MNYVDTASCQRFKELKNLFIANCQAVYDDAAHSPRVFRNELASLTTVVLNALRMMAWCIEGVQIEHGVRRSGCLGHGHQFGVRVLPTFLRPSPPALLQQPESRDIF